MTTKPDRRVQTITIANGTDETPGEYFYLENLDVVGIEFGGAGHAASVGDDVLWIAQRGGTERDVAWQDLPLAHGVTAAEHLSVDPAPFRSTRIIRPVLSAAATGAVTITLLCRDLASC
jgi:hypothetical protein